MTKKVLLKKTCVYLWVSRAESSLKLISWLGSFSQKITNNLSPTPFIWARDTFVSVWLISCVTPCNPCITQLQFSHNTHQSSPSDITHSKITWNLIYNSHIPRYKRTKIFGCEDAHSKFKFNMFILCFSHSFLFEYLKVNFLFSLKGFTFLFLTYFSFFLAIIYFLKKLMTYSVCK